MDPYRSRMASCSHQGNMRMFSGLPNFFAGVAAAIIVGSVLAVIAIYGLSPDEVITVTGR